MFSYSHLYERGEKMLTQWGLWPRRDVPVSSLSYGEQRQMEVILVLVQNPSLLLLDEPTSGLSLEDAKRFVSLIRSFPRNITILLIDHDMDVVFDIADKVLVLHFGRVLASGTPDEVRKNPQVQDVYMGRLHEPA
jgi:branched-chain amino acid transport system ATP-binding protein